MAKRAAVLIGVRRSGRLPKLQATTAGVRRMERWARDQGLDPVVSITDDDGPVTVRQVKQAIRMIVERGDVGQLLVYFSGHGVNVGYAEYWLLSEAIDDTNEAVNLRGTESLARYSPVPHVVFVSDACRTAAEGIRAGALTGSEIFPNPDGGGRLRAVDLFYAATLGRPAHEIRDPEVSSGRYRALYTEVLEECLRGRCPAVLETLENGDSRIELVRPRRLGEQLPRQVLARLRELGLDLSIAQEPDALVTSGPEAWLARIEAAGATRGVLDLDLSGPASGDLGDNSLPGEPNQPPPQTTHSRPARALLNLLLSAPADLALDLHRAVPPELLQRTATGLTGEEREILGEPPDAAGSADEADLANEADDRDRATLRAGFRVRGNGVARAYAAGASVEVLDEGLVRVEPDGEIDDVWLGFADGRAAVIPAIPEFSATLTFAEGELATVAFEPSPASWRWQEYRGARRELSLLRSLVAESARFGVFRPEGDRALRLAERIRRAKGLDPTLAIYAAYAYHDLHREDLLADMKSYLQQDVGILPYDIALLSGDLRGRAAGRGEGIHPAFPLLAQGWSLVRALGGRLPPRLETLQRHLVSSLWSLFDERGGAMLLDFMRREG